MLTCGNIKWYKLDCPPLLSSTCMTAVASYLCSPQRERAAVTPCWPEARCTDTRGDRQAARQQQSKQRGRHVAVARQCDRHSSRLARACLRQGWYVVHVHARHEHGCLQPPADATAASAYGGPWIQPCSLWGRAIPRPSGALTIRSHDAAPVRWHDGSSLHALVADALTWRDASPRHGSK